VRARWGLAPCHSLKDHQSAPIFGVGQRAAEILQLTLEGQAFGLEVAQRSIYGHRSF
jgi:hypothetical protein